MRPKGVFVGAATLDLHYLLPAVPGSNEKRPADRFGVYAGGPAANAAVTFSHLGGWARLYAEVGSHVLGRAIAADVSEFGVELVDVAATSTEPPMLSSIITTSGSGDRMVVASRHTEEAGTLEFPGELPPGTDVLLVDGFLASACERAVGAASAGGVPVVLDAGSWKPGFESLLGLIDIVICSADFRPPGAVSEGEVFEDLRQRGVSRVAMTRGAEPVLFRDGDASGEIPVGRVDVVDTLGAGDVFHGAFCFHWARGEDFAAALTAAAQVASLSTRSFGTRAWMGRS